MAIAAKVTTTGRIEVLLAGLDPGAAAFQRGLTAAKDLLVRRTVQAFAAQSPRRAFTAGWKARSVPNVAGIVTDLRRSAAMPPKRRFEARPAAIDTGRLRQSIAGEIVGGNVIRYGSILPYASAVQRGEASALPIGEIEKKNLAKLLKRRPELRAKLGFLFNLRVLTTKPPARPFVVCSAQDRADVAKVMQRELARG